MSGTLRLDDRGVATVWAAGAVTALIAVAIMVVYLGGVQVARQHAESAADLAALAGAARATAGEVDACAQARRVTERMRVDLSGCRLDGAQMRVEVRSPLTGPLARFGAVTARARAGPA